MVTATNSSEGKYRYIVVDLISHTTAVIQVEAEKTSLLMDVLCGVVFKSHFSFNAITLLCVGPA